MLRTIKGWNFSDISKHFAACFAINAVPELVKKLKENTNKKELTFMDYYIL